MTSLTLTIDALEPGVLRLVIAGADEVPIAAEKLPHQGHVDNLLLTAVDNLFKKHSLDKSALKLVLAGSGIDRNSSLYRIVLSLSSAISAAFPRKETGQ